MKTLFFIPLIFLYSCKYSNPLRDFPEKVLRAFETINYQPPLPKSALQIIGPKKMPILYQEKKGTIPIKKKVLSPYYTEDDVVLKAEDLPEGATFDPVAGEFVWTPEQKHLKSYEVSEKRKMYSFKVSLFTKKEPIIGVSKQINFLVERHFFKPEILTIEQVDAFGKVFEAENKTDMGEYNLFQDDFLYLRISVRDPSMESDKINPSVLKFYESNEIEKAQYLTDFNVSSSGEATQDPDYPDIWHYQVRVDWHPLLLSEISLRKDLEGTRNDKRSIFPTKRISVYAQSYRGKKSNKASLAFKLIRMPEAPNILSFRNKMPVYKGFKNYYHIPIFTFNSLSNVKIEIKGVCAQEYDFAQRKFVDSSKQNTRLNKNDFPGDIDCYCAPVDSNEYKNRYSGFGSSQLASLYKGMKKDERNPENKGKKDIPRMHFIACDIEAEVRDDFLVIPNDVHNSYHLGIEASSYYAKGTVHDSIFEKYKNSTHSDTKTNKNFYLTVKGKEENPSFEVMNQLNQQLTEKKDRSKENDLMSKQNVFKPESFVQKAQKDLKQVESFFLSYKASSFIEYLKSFFKSPPSYAHYRSYIAYFSFLSSSYHKKVIGDEKEVKELKKQTKKLSQKIKDSFKKDSNIEQTLMKKIFYIGVLDALGFYLDFLWSIKKEERKANFDLVIADLSKLTEEVFGFSYSDFFKTQSFKDILDQLNQDKSFHKQANRLRKLKTKYLMQLKKEKSKSGFKNVF